MRLICLWCAVIIGVMGQGPLDDRFYAPQTFIQHGLKRSEGSLFQPMYKQWDHMTRIPNRLEAYQQGLFKPAPQKDITPQSSSPSWRPAPVHEPWTPLPAPELKPEPWRPPFAATKEQQAHILHHKQALSSDGNFRFEYASDNGLAAGEVIEPDGSRVGAYQYKDPNGQVVKLKYRAGKDGFQILEGSHLPKSPEPVAPPQQDHHYQTAYEQQRQQFELQQQYNLIKPKQPIWTGVNQGSVPAPQAGNQYFNQNWQDRGKEDDGQYRENDIDQDINNRGPHNFGEGYAFAFQGSTCDNTPPDVKLECGP